MKAGYKVLLASATVFAASTAHSVSVYDPTAQFDVLNNPSVAEGWSYGYSTTLGGQFAPLVAKPNPPLFFDWAYSQSNFYPDIEKNISGGDLLEQGGWSWPKGAISLAGGVGVTNGYYAVLRWTVPESNIYSLDAAFRGVWDKQGSQSQVHVQLNGADLFTALVQRQSTVSFVSTLALTAGDHLDFSLGHDAGVTVPFERSLIFATITSVPETATAALSLAGLAALGVFGLFTRRRDIWAAS